MRRLYKLVSLAFVLVLLLSLSPAAYALVDQSESFYVADYAGVLSESTEQTIINYNGALEQQCKGAQIVVVTVGYLDGMKSDEYAYQLFNDWGVGSADYNNGMLLLLAVNENKAWLAYGLGLTSQLSSSDVDRLLDSYFWTDFDKGNYDSAVTKLFTALLGVYDGIYGTALSGAGSNQTGGATTSAGDIIVGVIRVLVIIAILEAIFGNGGGSTRGTRRGSWLPWMLFFNSMNRGSRGGYSGRGNWPPRGGGGFGGGGFGGGFGGGMGRGGGGFSGGGGGRR